MKASFTLCLLLATSTFLNIKAATLNDIYKRYTNILDQSKSLWPVENEHGSVPVNKNSGDTIFFWMFPSSSDRSKDPLVIWLSGGPGCSSELAQFVENGPITVDKSGKLGVNPHAWNKRANLVFLDQPVGTGFSKAAHIWDMNTTEEQIAENLFETLNGFIRLYPEFEGRDLYVTGESYAGHYIPFFAKHIDDHKTETKANFVGVAIGNGLVDPINQYDAYAHFAYENGIIGKPLEVLMLAALQVCKVLTYFKIPVLDIDVCNLAMSIPMGLPIAPSFNPYDYTIKCDKPPLCYDFDAVTTLLNRDDVQKDLGVYKTSWEACNMEVHIALLNDWATSGAAAIKQIAENGYKVLIYNGEKDYICNWMGGYDWVTRLNWKGKEEFNKLTLDKCEVGHCQEYKNLRFIKFGGAGHMVPMDQPENALKMIDDLVNWKPEPLEIEVSDAELQAIVSDE